MNNTRLCYDAMNQRARAEIATVNDDKSYRKLTTVLAADAVGFSRLMAADEIGTVAFFQRIHERVFQPAANNNVTTN